MPRDIRIKKEKGSMTKSILIGTVIGGIVGASLALLGTFGEIISSLEGIIALTVLGTLAGAVIGLLSGLSIRDQDSHHKADSEDEKPLKKAFRSIRDNARLQLREEQLEISKELVHTADIKSHKEVITEEKTITVPITREELVIEKRELDHNDAGEYEEIMRIPVTEEKIDVQKIPVKLEDVSIYTNEYEEIEHIEETLKREEAHVETSGNVKVIEEDEER